MRYEIFHGHPESYIFALEGRGKLCWWCGYSEFRNCAADAFAIVRGGRPAEQEWGHGTLCNAEPYRAYLQIAHKYRDQRYVLEEVTDEVFSAAFE